MQAPVGQVHLKLVAWELQAANKEDEGDGSIHDAVLGPDYSAMGCNIWKATLSTREERSTMPPGKHILGNRYAKAQLTPKPITSH